MIIKKVPSSVVGLIKQIKIIIKNIKQKVMFSVLKRLFCKHEFEWLRNIYGDEINYCGWKRSIWKCKKCGKIQYRDELYGK